MYSAAGYVVFYPNPRGSTSYGEEFGNLLYRNYPGDDYHDVMDGVDKMLELGYIDMEKLDPIGRLNGFGYSRLGEIMQRKFEDGQSR